MVADIVCLLSAGGVFVKRKVAAIISILLVIAFLMTIIAPLLK